MYRHNFGDTHFHLGDVASFSAPDLPNHCQLAWASFPCQDLSLAGWQRGLSAIRSGTFWPFWKILKEQFDSGHRPPVVVLENVLGVLYGDSFSGLCDALVALDMQFGALVIDARRFVPQSRPRVFIVAVDARLNCSHLTTNEGVAAWTPPALTTAQGQLPPSVAAFWRWWNVPVPKTPPEPVDQLIEDEPTGVEWHSAEETKRLLGMMNEHHRAKIEKAQQLGNRIIGFVYKRIRDGVQRAEIRFDGIAGCLRTPKGGSSRQTVVVIDNGRVRSRLLSPREAARLMGVPDTFKLPDSYNDAYKAMGDAVVVPVVDWLSQHLLQPLCEVALGTERSNPIIRSTRVVARAEKRAAGWSMEHKRMAPKRLVDACLKTLAEWHGELDTAKSTSLDSFIACAGIKIAETTKTKWPIERTDYVSSGGRFRSTGPFIQSVLKRFGEEREYTSEGGRTTGSCIEAAAALVKRLERLPEYQSAAPDDRTAVAEAMQEWLYKTVVKPSLDSEGLRVEISLEKSPPDIIGDILAAALKQKVSGAVAQHLVGAKLALRYPKRKIENYCHTTQDKQLGRKGDFHLNDTVIHVTMTPSDVSAEKCARTARGGSEVLWLVPRTEVPAAEAFVRRCETRKTIWVQSIEAFVGQNLLEMGEFGRNGFRDTMKLLLEMYNKRVAASETQRAIFIKIPENLQRGG